MRRTTCGTELITERARFIEDGIENAPAPLQAAAREDPAHERAQRAARGGHQ